MTSLRRWLVAPVLVSAIAGTASSCISVSTLPKGPGTFVVTVRKVNGNDPPGATDTPLQPNLGVTDDQWTVSVDAVDESGKPTDFNGYLRVSVRPGTVDFITDLSTGQTTGRNILMKNGHADATVPVRLVYGPTRLIVEDVGYVPAPPGKVPACSDGIDNNGNKLIDYPSDPGCYAADDDSEDGGSFVSAVSPPVNYFLPTLRDINGYGAKTPYNLDAVQARADDTQHFLVVTRVSNQGFFVTDLNDQGQGYNHLYAFNFSTPIKMQVCDQVTYLSGTMGVFFGYNELNFPSYRLNPLYVGQQDLCRVPEPSVLDTATITSTPQMKKYQSGFVRIENFNIGKHFGSKLVVNNLPAPGASNCDFNGDGKIEFTDATENACSAACDADIECSEWTEFASRGNYKVHSGNAHIQVNTDTVGSFEPQANPGLPITVAGTLTFFSGGKNNWTVESRCPDDLVCTAADGSLIPGCSAQVTDSKHACVNITRTIDDNDMASN